ASPPSSASIDATSNPRMLSFSAMSSAGASRSTNSRSQDRTSRTSIRELLEESKVVLVKETDVFNLVSQDRNPLDADAPCESGVSLRIVADGFEDRRVHHAAATQLDPAALLAHRAAGAVALPARDVELRARFGVREEARPESQPDVRRKHVARRMFGRHVQRVEAVPLVLDFRTFDDGEAHAREDLFEPIADDGEWMAMPERRQAPGERDVDRAGRSGGRGGVLSVLRPAGFD